MTELLTTAVSDTEERQRLMSSEDARPSELSPLPVSSAVVAAGPKVQFAAASTVLDETDDAAAGGRGMDDGKEGRGLRLEIISIVDRNLQNKRPPARGITKKY